jgi:GTP-binding protein HflX
MFATLDPTVRQIRLPSGRRVLVSDTVGFIRNLPTTLVDAFRATLEEVTAAVLLLHVVDVTSPDASEHTAHVLTVLGEIGAETTPEILVLNKADRLAHQGADQDPETLTHRIMGETARQNATEAVLVSAQTGLGIDELLGKIDQRIALDPVSRQRFRLPLGEGRAMHLLHERAAILSKEYRDDACDIVAETPESLRNLLSEYWIPES